MNANDDRSLGFDPRVADWLQGEPDRAPGQVMETVLAAFPSVPQRHRVPGLARLRTRRTLTLGWAVALLVALTALAFVAAGASLLLSPPARIVDASLSPSPISSRPIPSAAPSPTPAASPAGLPADAAMFADLGSFFAASDDVTWVSTATAMYRTEDTGRTWRAVQPAGWSSTGMTTFVDADTAYFSTGGRPAAIYATHDGGSSWTRTSVDAGADVIWPTFSFQTPTSGFATFVDPARDDAPAGTGLLVFATTDGGVTWTGPMPGVQPHLDASMNKLEPANGAFLVHSAGKGSFAFENWFFVSADGGVTWTRYAFPTGKLAPKNVMKGVGEILREANGHLLISLGVQSSGSPIPEAIYESGNDTSTWRLVSEAPPGDMSVQLLSDTTWVLTGPDEIRTTTDAGAHWTSLVPPASLFYEQPSLQFATLRTGWATLECQHVKGHDCGTNPRAIVLFVTTDSGATWTPIGG